MTDVGMLSINIIGTEKFINMPINARCLYFHLSINAKYKGLINNIKSTCRRLGCDQTDIDILINNGYINKINDYNYQINDWYENNNILFNSKKRLSYQYRKWRENVLKRDNYTCQKCGIFNKNLNVHHLKSFAKFKELRYEINNGITLCIDCHRKIHKKVEAGD